jgi:hypothetical protein
MKMKTRAATAAAAASTAPETLTKKKQKKTPIAAIATTTTTQRNTAQQAPTTGIHDSETVISLPNTVTRIQGAKAPGVETASTVTPQAGTGSAQGTEPPKVASGSATAPGTDPPQVVSGSATAWDKLKKNCMKQSSAQMQPAGKTPPEPCKPKTQQQLQKEIRTTARRKKREDIIVAGLPTEVWPLYADIKMRWSNRPAPFRALTSLAWQNTQEKLLWLLAIPEGDMYEEFQNLIDENNWCYGTASQYWSAALKAAEATGVQVTAAMRIQQKVYAFMAKEEKGRRETIPLLKDQLTTVLGHVPMTDAILRVAIEVAFVLGQRMGDMLRVRTADISTVVDPPRNGSPMAEYICITFRYGKTIRRRQPFTLHLPATSPLAKTVLALHASRMTEEYLFVASDHAREPALRIIRGALKLTQDSLTILSIRRGGLQAMALDGMSLTTLMHHSRHSSTELLERYLGWGKLMLHAARERFAQPVTVTS